MKCWHKLLLLVATGVAVDRVLLRPWYLRWGATNDEFRKHLAR
jgi:hypothetical protein